MNSFEDIKIAIVYSYNSMTLITWLVLVFGVLKTVQAFNKAYSEHNSYKEMKNNADKSAITQFYYGVIIAFLCVIIFFLPYLINYNN